MAFSNEDYSMNNILKFSKEEIQAELNAVLNSNEVSAKLGYEAEMAGNMSLAFAHAADMGVDNVKCAILQDALTAKGLADGTVDIGEVLSRLLGTN